VEHSGETKIFPIPNDICVENYAVPENIHTLPKGIIISWRCGDSVRPKNLKKCTKLNWNFQRGA